MELDGADLTFRVGNYDHGLPLIIDPLVATYSTFIGTNTDAGYDNVTSLATDAQGNVYLGGVTVFDLDLSAEQSEHGFPTTPSSLAPTDPRAASPTAGPCAATQCGYVLKLDRKQQVVYGALIHGELVNSIAVDSAGSAYATGTNDENPMSLSLTSGSFSDNGVTSLSFVFKLTPDGSDFIYNAALAADSGNGIAVDRQGNAYVVGLVRAPGLPTTPGALKPNYQAESDNTTNNDGFLIKINPTGSTLVYGTYLGGLGADVANSVTVDSVGIATVTGQTSSSDFVGMPQTLHGPSDAFVVQLSADGSSVLHGTFLGGSQAENATSVASDNQGGFLVSGATTSPDFPVTSGVYQTSLLGQRNGWVVRLDSAFNVIYSTYLGGSQVDGVQAIAADENANAYVAGVSYSSDLPTTPDGFQDISSSATNDPLANAGPEFYLNAPLEPAREGYLGVLSANGQQILYGSFLSGYTDGPSLTIANAISISPTGPIYVSGTTVAGSFPVTDGGLRAAMGSDGSGFLAKFENSGLRVASPSLLPKMEIDAAGSPYNYQLQASGGTPPYQWEAVGSSPLPDGLSLTGSGLITGTPARQQSELVGGYQFTAKVTDAAGTAAYKSLFIDDDFDRALLCSPNLCSVEIPVVADSLDPSFGYAIPNLARGSAPFKVAISGNPPPKLTMNADQSFSVVASTVGDFQFAFTVTDSTGRAGVLNWDVKVLPQSSSSSSSGGSSSGGSSSGGSSSGGSSSGGSSSGGSSSGGSSSGGSAGGSTSSGGSTSPSTGVTKGGGGALDVVSLSMLLAALAGRRSGLRIKAIRRPH
jgi:hypothetical protein